MTISHLKKLVPKLCSRCNDVKLCMCIFFLFCWHLTTWHSLFCTAVYSTSLELPLYMSIFTCRAVFSVFSLHFASLTLIWASWMGYLQTCSHRSRWLKMISKMHDENADLCGLKQLDLLSFILQSLIKTSKTAKCCKHGIQRPTENSRTAVFLSFVLCAD